MFKSFKEFQEIKNEAFKVGAITAEEFFDGGSLSGKISQLYICELLVRHHEKIFENEALKSREEIIRAVISKSID